MTNTNFCTEVKSVKELFKSLNVETVVVELDVIERGQELRQALSARVGRTSVPQVFISGQHIGGCDDTHRARDDGLLAKLLKGHDYDYDLIVIGGGSGGLAASKEAVKYNKKVAVLDFVVPTPLGTAWGLGGTCVNVGCIPKKLMHTAALIGQTLKDAPHYGWNIPGDCPGVKEFAITSDDLFSLPYCPGKTLVIGASYVALECAGFLRGLGLDVTVMVRSILLRGFDQEMAEKAGQYMAEEGVKFLRPSIPQRIQQLESGAPGRLLVTAKRTDNNQEFSEEYNTVLFAIGRDPCTDTIGLENAGVLKEKNGKLATISEKTNVDNIYAVGDILYGKLELTPVAIEAGVLLARRLFGGSNVECDYINVPTTVFTPLEYGACGYTEEQAVQTFGEQNIEERLLGFHYLGPNAGEVTQLVGLSLKMKATKADLDALIGIHPTCAEVFTTLDVTKRSGLAPDLKSCCG
ncbi:unnamed protein product [Medioppia subpectinata]|uniref:thioredoxin-disulfide reductase (NADPH) n=2 Tax=Medioppia subpectinata TaxID=1979941 RepID=A0A7R9KKU9_9ACAR|nr:unnamed protein product [Medioppia subpectinata]CAG2105463.1 unnamed protein product [Medioppia subpectinata]